MKFSKRLVAGALCATMAFSLAGCSCSIPSPSKDEDTCLVKVGDNEISYEEGRVYIFVTEALAENMFLQYSALGADYDWDTKPTEGKDETIADNYKTNVMEGIVEDEIQYQEAIASGKYTVSEDELKKIEENAKTLMSKLSEDTIEKNGFTEEMFVNFQKKVNIASKYAYDTKKNITIDRAEVEKDVDYDKKYKQYKTEYVSYVLSTTDEDGNTVDFTDEQKAEAKKVMEDIAKEIKAGKTLEEAAKSNDKVTYSTRDYTVADLETEADYFKTTSALNVGECSDIFEANSTYFIAKLLDNDSKDAYNKAVDELVESKKSEKFNEDLDKLKEDKYKVEINDKVWDAVELGNCTIIADEYLKAYGLLTDKSEDNQ